MKDRRVEVSLSQELWDGLERVRGFEPRASFVKRALESALSEAKRSSGIEQAAPDLVGSSEPVRAAAPSRALTTRTQKAVAVGDVRTQSSGRLALDRQQSSVPSRAPDVLDEPLAPSGKLKPRPVPGRACPECGAAGPLHQRGCSRMGKS